IFAGRTSRSEAAWKARVALAERLDARVVTGLKTGAAFPTDHPLHAGAPSNMAPAEETVAIIRNADAIVSLDWVDLAGTLKPICGAEPSAKTVQVSLDHQLHN